MEGNRVKDVKIPKSVLIIAILRDGEVIISYGDTIYGYFCSIYIVNFFGRYRLFKYNKLVATTLGNIGPGFALVGPTQNFSFFSPLSKALFSLLMLFGRLELFTVFLFFVPEFWENI